MPMLREALSRRAWRRAVVAYIVDRLDDEGMLFLVGSGYEDRREMLKVASMLPEDVIVELYEDSAHPGYTFMDARLISYEATVPDDQVFDWQGREQAV